MWSDFFGNPAVVQALERMVAQDRVPQTLLFAGPAGVGKATAARRLAGSLVGQQKLIERDDLSRPENVELLREREKLAADKRNDDPLLFQSHSDFVTFPPDGPLRQISIHQIRLLKERAQFQPSKGDRRVFLIDQVHRAGEHASNSLLKILEEPPDYLTLVLTTENYYDVLPTIRSRSVAFHFAPLSGEEMRSFARARGLDEPARRAAFAQGCPGRAVSLDLAEWEQRRSVMLALLKTAADQVSFGAWAGSSEKFLRSNQERLEDYLEMLYTLIEDLLRLLTGSQAIRNSDIREELQDLARQVDLRWIKEAVNGADGLAAGLRRNIQKGIALDALVVKLRELRAG